MKKLLFVGILLLSGVAFSAVNTEVEENLKVTAEVVKSLSISTTPLDFGLVPQGGKNLPNVTNGSISLKGQEGKKVLLSFYDTVNNSEETLADGRVHLKAPTARYWIMAVLKINGIVLGEFKDVTLTSDNENKLTVTGTIETVKPDAETGSYEGAVKIAAKYEYNTGK